LIKKEMLKKTKQASLGFLFITMVIDVTGWGIIIPVLPKLIQELTHSTISEASGYGGWLLFAYAFTQFIFAPLMGNLSDQYGRRPIILFSLLAFSLDHVLMALAPTITWLFIGRIIAGFTGASITSAMAYIADISTVENKSKNFGLVGAAFGLGFIIGPVIGGLLGQFGSRLPFYAAAILCFLNFVYGYFFLPESLPKERRRQMEWQKTNPFNALLNLKKYPSLIGLVFASALVYIGSHAVHTNWSYYMMYQLNWSEKEIGISLGIIGILVGFVQGILIRWINPKIGNAKSILLGLVLYTIGMFLFAIVQKNWMVYLFLIPYCLGGISGPALQSVISSKVPSNEQGEIQGTLASVMSITSIIGPIIMTGIFAYFTSKERSFTFAGAPFVLGGVLMFLSIFIAKFSLKKE
jgi:MFS transporter, DHA1 family, tetracycline resistance protein